MTIECFVVLARHVKDEMVIDLFVDLVDLVRRLRVSSQTGGVVGPVLHYYFRVLFEVFFVGAEVVIAASSLGLNGVEIGGRYRLQFADVDGPRCLRSTFVPPNHRGQAFPMGNSWLGVDGFFLLAIRVHNIENLIVGLRVDILPDDESIDGLALLHVLVDIHKVIVGVVEIEGFVLAGQAELDDPGWEIGEFDFHDFLEVDVADVVEDPLELDVGDVGAAGHGQVVHDLIRHEIRVLLVLAEHKVHCQFFQGLDVLVAIVITSDGAQQDHDLAFRPLVQVFVDLSAGVGVLGVEDGLGLLLVLDIGLEVGGLRRYLWDGGQGIQLKLRLVEELAVAVIVLDDAEGLFLVHLVLLDLLDLVLLIAVEHIAAEVVLVIFESAAVVAGVEVRGHQLLEVLEVHVLRVDLVQHLLVIALFQQTLVLPPQPQEGRVDEFKWCKPGNLHHSPVLAVGLEYFQRLALHEEDVGQEEFECLGAAERKSVEQPLEPPRGLLAVGVEHVAVGLALVVEAAGVAQQAPAIVLPRQVAVRVDGFLQVAHHERRDLLQVGRGRAERDPLLELGAHARVAIKIIIAGTPMKQIQLTVDQGSFRRSAMVARRTTKSERISRSQVQSLRKKADDRLMENEETDIYFDKGKRRSYFRNIIDNYFIPHDSQAHFLESEPNMAMAPPLLSRDSKSSESSRVKHNGSISRLKLKSKLSMMDFSMPEMSSLPVIEEGLTGHKRPSSVHQPSSFISLDRSSLIEKEKEKEKDLEESLFYESSKSLIENSQVEMADSFKLVAIHKAGKRLGRAKVYSSQDNQQLKRENSAKKIGMQVLWTPASTINSIEFPNYKTLRELCYSIVEDKNGEQPVSLLYPTPYYFTLFANQCEELIDIIVSLARGVAKGCGMVANNQIHVKNVVKAGEKRFLLTDWGCASIREGFTVQGRTFNKDLGALCRDGNKWLVAPQYLAPEMLRATQTGYYDHLWRQRGGVGSCDIWSIGCLIFELITLVPLDSPYYCLLKGRERRRGVFGSKIKTAEKILSRQRNFKNYAVRCIREEMRVRKQLKINEKLVQLLPRMLEESVDHRATADQILMRLA